MKKFLLSAFLIILFTLYVIHQRTERGEGNVVAPPVKQAPLNNIPQESTMATPTVDQDPTATQQPQNINTYRDGEFTGIVADAFYGPLQVKITIIGGKISDVIFLQYPSDRGTSIEINRQAMPYLKEEAISAQSANVDIITGATQTSEAFRQTLKSALDQAKG